MKQLLKYGLYALLLPILYLATAFLLTACTVHRQQTPELGEPQIFLTTNGIHLDIVLPLVAIDERLKTGLALTGSEAYCAFGWGDHDFYLETPTWEDFTVKNVFKAAFLKTSTLMHVTRYPAQQRTWVAVPVTAEQLDKLNAFILQSFALDEAGNKQILPNKGYHRYDDFYEAVGSYSVLYNCNSWANDALKSSEMKACYWTVFDFGLLNKYDD